MPTTNATTQLQSTAPVFTNPYASSSHAPLAMLLFVAALACFCVGFILAYRGTLRGLWSVSRLDSLPAREAVRQSA